MRMIRSGYSRDKKILLLDKQAKSTNDRTWCFWEQQPGFFENIVYREWEKISFLSEEFSAVMDIPPYQYKMIRGIDFYRYCFEEIRKHSNIEVVVGDVKGWEYEKDDLLLQIDDEQYRLFAAHTQLFNSFYKPAPRRNKTIRLLQHFKGWVIETDKPVFDPSEATIMDFRVDQQYGTSFVYTLPLSATTALVEFTLFTKELLQPEQYNDELKKYISHFLRIDEYKVTDQEFGVIPMTNEKFSFAGNGWQIGMAGGQTKASSGYTFQFIQKQSEQIVDCLVAGRDLKKLPAASKRFRFYDNTLLYILYHNKVPGKKIFTDLFKKNKPQQVLGFLDNESSFKEELKIISTLPAWPFFKAAIKQL